MTTWDELTSRSIADVLDWSATQSWASEMSRCQQDALWHAEGDV